jgi:hypothetical protein
MDEPQRPEVLGIDEEEILAMAAEDEKPDAGREESKGPRRLILTPASTIAPRRAKWMWEGRMAVGALSLVAGREGIAKSTFVYWIVSNVTRGTLPGESFGTPRAVMICATEDAWAETIVPRLIAAGADLTRVYRIEVETNVGLAELSLPADIVAVGQAADDYDVALLVLDPLMSRLSSSLDTHRDAEVRQALEPLTKMCFDHGLSAIGLMHFNKSGSDDPMNALMASRAFSAVARSVSTVVKDPDDESDTRRFFGTPKNNLGPTNLPLLSFTVENAVVPTEDGDAHVGRIRFGEEVNESITEVLRRSEDGRDRTQTLEATDWLGDYMTQADGRADSATIKKAGKAAGHSASAIQRARKKLRLVTESSGYPRRTEWFTPAAHEEWLLFDSLDEEQA